MFVIGLEKLYWMSTIGEKAQVHPSAPASRAITVPRRSANVTSHVAATCIALANDVPSTYRPLAPLSTSAESSIGIGAASWTSRATGTTSAAGNARNMKPLGVATSKTLRIPSASFTRHTRWNKWPTFALRSIPASVVFTHSAASASRLNGAALTLIIDSPSGHDKA